MGSSPMVLINVSQYNLHKTNKGNRVHLKAKVLFCRF